MNIKTLQIGIASVFLSAALSGCDKSSSNNAADAVKSSTESTATAVQQGADKAAVAPPSPAAAAEGEATTVIAKAQNLVGEKKYQEALTTLGALKDLKLSDAQQKAVDELKAQIQKQMSGDAGKAVGNLLGK